MGSPVEWSLRRDTLKNAFDPLVRPILAAQPFRYYDEASMVRHLERVLANAGIPTTREARLRIFGRIDLRTTGRWPVGIEVKARDNGRYAIEQQLACYARSGLLHGLILVTAVERHLRLGDIGLGLAFLVVHLSGAVRAPTLATRL
ncbi:hypothetical protein SAMN04487818_1226 [Actinokineospora terrae]|uniref:PD-(D/E)XK nuclease superfamily protein n=1 Tax=Actinokineospora terrae TaxID=155974 RepID=A0A1H9XRI9_9PSEU|nr:hypothetical protein SAMN04487818_1226 [Actinokineospora terrae]